LIAPLSSVFGNTKPIENWLDTMLNGIMGIIGGVIGYTPLPQVPAQPGRSNEPRSTGPVTINVNNGNVTAQDIANKINRANRSTGTNLIRTN
jgi:hypothetical protein